MLSRFGDLSDPDHRAVLETLEELQDPRATAPLTSTLENRALPRLLREEAGALLRGLSDWAQAETLSSWWSSGDAVLERHALLQMGREHADVVVAVASDRGHRLHREAVGRMTFRFEEPEFQRVKISALEHEHAEVRMVAADVLHWDEPVDAEQALIRCTEDSVIEVAVSATCTLQYYPSLQTTRALTMLLEHADEQVRAAARSSLDEISSTFSALLGDRDPRERDILATWMSPVCAALELGKDAASPETVSNPTSRGVEAQTQRTLSVGDLVKVLSDPDGRWREKNAHVPSARAADHYAPARTVLVPFLSQHPDPGVRERACGLLAAWNEHGALVQMMGDPSFSVRKSATYHLGEATADHGIAATVWEHLHHPGTASAHAMETLRTYVAHAPRGESLPRLAALVLHDVRESVRHEAVEALTKLNAAPELTSLLGLLAEPPRVTWSVHLALLGAIRKLKLRTPELTPLYGIDNAYMQAALAPFRTS